MINTPHYLLVASKSWNREIFFRTIADYPGEWRLITDKELLSCSKIEEFAPQIIFFLHWSWKVPSEILQQYECICFHMTDLPYGRGGSPLQNLIVRGHKTTKLTAFRMTEDFDAGPVYLKEELTLSGSATEIFTRASSLAAQMILTIIEQHPSPQPQTGEIISFRRRKPEESRIPEEALLDTVYDYIRMLDGEGYPRAFIETGGLRYEFCNAHQEDGKIHADVIISATGKNKI